MEKSNEGVQSILKTEIARYLKNSLQMNNLVTVLADDDVFLQPLSQLNECIESQLRAVLLALIDAGDFLKAEKLIKHFSNGQVVQKSKSRSTKSDSQKPDYNILPLFNDNEKTTDNGKTVETEVTNLQQFEPPPEPTELKDEFSDAEREETNEDLPPSNPTGKASPLLIPEYAEWICLKIFASNISLKRRNFYPLAYDLAASKGWIGSFEEEIGTRGKPRYHKHFDNTITSLMLHHSPPKIRFVRNGLKKHIPIEITDIGRAHLEVLTRKIEFMQRKDSGEDTSDNNIEQA